MEENKTMAGMAEQETTREIAPGMTVEEITAMFFNADALREPGYKVYQLNGDGHRYYYRFNNNGEPEFYPSVTTLLKQVMPTSPALIKWIVENGDNANEKRDLAAAYGTFMHGQFERLIINRRYNFDTVAQELHGFMERENLPEKFFNENIGKIRKDVLAFAQFIKDYNVKPLAIEIGLVHPEYRYAGCVDMPCIMTDPKTGEMFRAIVDFKSGRKGFFEEHELQLHLYMMMWNVNFPDMEIDRVFNFSPKDWRTKPTYNLKDQTGSANAKKIPALLELATIEDEKRDNTFTVIGGEMSLDDFDASKNIISLSLAELVKMSTPELVQGKKPERETEIQEPAKGTLRNPIDPTDAKKAFVAKPAKPATADLLNDSNLF